MIKYLIAAAALVATVTSGEVQETGFRQMIGTKHLLVLRLSTPDSSNQRTYAQETTRMAQVADQTDISSYHKFHLTYEIAPNVLMLPRPSTYYKSLGGAKKAEALRVDAVAAAQAAGYDITLTDYKAYDRLVMVLPSLVNFNWRIGHTAMFSAVVPSAALHELGHTWLFAHSGLWKVTDGNPLSPTGKDNQYADPFDVMGQSYTTFYKQADYSVFHKYWAGWVDDSQVAVSDQAGTYVYTINSFDNVNATGLLAIRIPYGTMEYWVGFRRAWGSMSDLRSSSAHGAYIVKTGGHLAGSGWDGHTQLIDTKASTSTPNDACLAVGQTLNDTVNHITITTLSQSGDSITIQVVRQ